MCPICLLTTIIYSICWIGTFIGLGVLTKKIKFKYHLWANTKCDKCKNLESNGNTKCNKRH